MFSTLPVTGAFFLCILSLVSSVPSMAQPHQSLQTLKTLKVEKEDWCTDYDRSLYVYPRTIELDVIRSQGGMFSPYDMTCFSSRRESDVEHIVALAEAHRSGMCSRGNREKKRFASDLLNLTLATPTLNRDEKIAKDAAHWMPSHNQCWFVSRIVEVKKKYSLSVDKAERRALKRVLEQCLATNMKIPPCNQ